MKVLVTGGAGSLGRALVRVLAREGHAPRVMSRRGRAESAPDGVEWARADLLTGEGLAAAVEGAHAVVHAASDPRRAEAVDVGGTRRLTEAARAAGCAHLVYISIVGVDVIPFGYYRRKLAAEGIIQSSGVPFSVLRATQFHSLVDFLLAQAARVPLLMPLPTDFKFRSVDEAEVAARLSACVAAGPRGRLPDFGGPEVLTLGEMARAWARAKNVGKRIIHLPIPGALAAAFRAGKNTAPEGERGVTGWADWLARRDGAGAA
ncbi:MAG TPA: NAD(P)H-binding protein [Pyrinomonadaceae bacterium]